MPIDIDTIMDDFYNNDTPLIDLTNPKTFVLCAIIAILFGVMIGLGYNIVFESLDCTNTYAVVSDTSTQMLSDTLYASKTICMPDDWVRMKLPIVIITLLAGILTGASPYLVKAWVKREKDEDAE